MKNFDYPALQFWANVVQYVLTGVLALYVRRVAKQKAVADRLARIEKTLRDHVTTDKCLQTHAELTQGCESHKTRTATMEATASALRVELDHLPTQRQFDLLNASITALNGELKNTQGRLDGINRAVDLINEFLINQGAGGKRG